MNADQDHVRRFLALVEAASDSIEPLSDDEVRSELSEDGARLDPPAHTITRPITEDDVYEIGKRDGYEDAIQTLDLATGGDGEFKGSTIPGATVDVPAMQSRIIARFHSQSAPQPAIPADVREALESETIQTLLDLLNPLHDELDRQTYDEKVRENFDAPRDREYDVSITARMERDLTQAICILESRLAALASTSAGQQKEG